MANQSVSVFNFQSNEVRVINRDGEIWFIASDVAAVLKYRDAANMTRILDDDEKGTHIVSTPSGDQTMVVINESGLYHAVLKSRKPEAKPFRKWVTADVLPSIRKTGSYTLPRVAISPEQKAALFAIVSRRAGDSGKLRAQLWSRHNSHFRIAKYEELLAIHFDDAVHYLETLELSAPKQEALPAPERLAINYPASWIIEQNQPVLKGENRVMGTLCLSLHNLTNPDLQLPLKAILNTLKKAGYTVEAAEAELFALYNQLGKASQLFGLMNTGLKDVLCLTDKGKHQYSSTFPAIPV